MTLPIKVRTRIRNVILHIEKKKSSLLKMNLGGVDSAPVIKWTIHCSLICLDTEPRHSICMYSAIFLCTCMVDRVELRVLSLYQCVVLNFQADSSNLVSCSTTQLLKFDYFYKTSPNKKNNHLELFSHFSTMYLQIKGR